VYEINKLNNNYLLIFFIVEKINEILAKLTLEKGKGNQAKVANALGLKPQTFGNYLKGRKLPGSLIAKWKQVYGEDLISMSSLSTDLSTNVSRGTPQDNNGRESIKTMPMDVWHKVLKDGERFDEVLDMNKEEIRNLWILIHDLRSRNLDPHKA
jgi:hypothetical protein